MAEESQPKVTRTYLCPVMHTNYYFLRQLAPSLQKRMVKPGQSPLRFMEGFSQDRDELVLAFAQARGKSNYYKPFYIKATLRPDFSGLLFPETIHRARANSASLFESVAGAEGRAVVGVRSFLNERCLAILLADGYALVFKFFGNRPNLLAFLGNDVIKVFNQKLVSDAQLKFDTLDRPLDQSWAAFERADFDYRKLFPTFGKVVNAYIQQEREKGEEETWPFLQNVLRQLEQPRYYLTRFNHQPTLSLLPVGEVVAEFDDPMEAANRFYNTYTSRTAFESEKAQWLHRIEKARKRAEAQMEATMQRLIQREEEVSHEEMGHILMANLHDIPYAPGTGSPERVSLYDFYRNQPITLKLKPDLSPQKNAENYYRKAKNEAIETQYLNDQLAAREAQLKALGQRGTDLAAIQTLKELRQYVKQRNLPGDHSPGPTTRDGAPTPLFKEVTFETFRILIGRNARNNDLLTQKYAYKDDLWLHARDVAGSHVLIKYQAGKPFPRRVIERAAELAAWYSKRRTDSLCPVIATPKKFVRKPKGFAEGQVIVEKEDVLLVVPKGED